MKIPENKWFSPLFESWGTLCKGIDTQNIQEFLSDVMANDPTAILLFNESYKESNAAGNTTFNDIADKFIENLLRSGKIAKVDGIWKSINAGQQMAENEV